MKDNEENKITNQNIDQNQQKNNAFNVIIAVSTLIIAILGATFAYFSATATSPNNDISVRSAFVSITYNGSPAIKANNLIPSTEKIAIAMYQKEAPKGDDGEYHTKDDGYAFLDSDDNYINDPSRKCVDAKGREVCYVYEFEIKSDGEEDDTTEVAGAIKIGKNQFNNLSYILYEVDYEKNEEGEELLDKFGHKVIKNYTVISKFNNVDSNADHEDTDPNFNFFEKPILNKDEDGNHLSTTHPYACLFGFSNKYNTAEKDSLDRCETIKIKNQTTHTYQVLVWLMEANSIQDEQNFSFEGTINLEVIGKDGGDDEGHITGTTTGE